MSVMLALSALVTNLLIRPKVYREGGPASGRALTCLAHEFFSSELASLYDLATILILWLTGASAMAALLNLVPRYLPRFGMVPTWTARSRPLILVLLAINVREPPPPSPVRRSRHSPPDSRARAGRRDLSHGFFEQSILPFLISRTLARA